MKEIKIVLSDNYITLEGDPAVLLDLSRNLGYNDDLHTWERMHGPDFDEGNPEHVRWMLDITRREWYQNYLHLLLGETINPRQLDARGVPGKPIQRWMSNDGHVSVVKLFKENTRARIRNGLMGPVLNWLREEYPDFALPVADQRTHPPGLTQEPVYELGGVVLRADQRPIIDQFRNELSDRENQGHLFSQVLLKLAPNTGKTYIAGMLVANLVGANVMMFHREKYLCARAVADYLKLGFDVGCLSADKTEVRRVLREQGCGRDPVWGMTSFTVAMVQTVESQLKSGKILLADLQKVNTGLFDECEGLVGDQTTALVDKMRMSMKIGYSGTPLDSESGYNRLTVRGLFGGHIYEVTTRDNIDLGVSLRPYVNFNLNSLRGVRDYSMSRAKNFIYTDAERLDLLIGRIKWHYGQGRSQVLVYYGDAELRHGDWLYKELTARMGMLADTAHVNGKSKDRSGMFARFIAGDVSILIANSVIRRGVNLPNLQVFCNWESTDNDITLEQAAIGRGTRVNGVDDCFYVEDFYDRGCHVLEALSEHRIREFRKEKHGAVVTFDYPNVEGIPA